MTKTEVIKKVSMRTNIPETTVEKVFDQIIDVIKQNLLGGNFITLRGFGTFTHKFRKSKKGRLITQNKEMIIPEYYKPILKFAPKFANLVKADVKDPKKPVLRRKVDKTND